MEAESVGSKYYCDSCKKAFQPGRTKMKKNPSYE